MMRRPFFRRDAAPGLARAFSLIEVLLAVFILALGLLGLGAMIPVVIREQREAADATLGLVAANNAEIYLKSRPDLNREFSWCNQPKYDANGGWNAWYARANNGGWSDDYAWKELVLWASPQNPELPAVWKKGEFNPRTGTIHIQAEANPTSTPSFITVRDRLWPDAAGGNTDPRFVWDFIARRIIPSAGTPKQIQVAVFVRRVDPNIRVPVGKTLLQAITQQLPEAQWRVAVGVTANVPVSKRRPTLDGTGEYAKIFAVNVKYSQSNRSRLELANPDAMTWDLFSRSGQRLVDNLGNIYTVVAVDKELANAVQIDPPVPEWIADTDAPQNYPFDGPDYRTAAGTLRQVILTPQIPAAVTVFNINIINPDSNPTGSGLGNVAP